MTVTENLSVPDIENLAHRLGRRSLVFVGLMGAGKTVIGRRVADALKLPFIDSDHEIETVSRMTVPDLFAAYGESEFRSLERRVIARLLKSGPRVVSTGGGAFMSAQTRRAVARRGISVWLKADLPTLMERVGRRSNRPLLNNDDPEGVMRRLMDERYPLYAEADIVVHSRNEAKEVIVAEVIAALDDHLQNQAPKGEDERWKDTRS